MQFKIFLSLILVAIILIFIGCGATQQVEQTGISEDEAAINNNFVPGKTSTGLCVMPETSTEKKKVLASYSLYRENFKQNNFDAALPYWRTVLKLASGFRKTPFVDGEVMYKAFIEQAENDEQKQMYIDSLFQLYDERIKCHGEEATVLQSKALFIYSGLNDQETAYPLLEEAMQKAGNSTSPLVLKTLVNKYRGDIKHGLKTEAEVISLVDEMKKIARYNIDNANNVKKYATALEALNLPLVAPPPKLKPLPNIPPELNTCDKVFHYYKEKYTANPEEIKILKNYYARWTSMKCYKENSNYEQIHRQLIADLNSKEPSRASWLQAAIYAAQDKDYPLAIEYYQNAINLEIDPVKQAEIYNYMAATYRGTKEYQKSAETAQKAISLNPDLGAAYTSLGWAYLGYFNKCGSTKKDRSAVAYVAADMFTKGKNAAIPDTKAQKGFNSAYVHFYTKSELHFDTSIKEGDAIRAGCWIQKSSTIRTKTQ